MRSHRALPLVASAVVLLVLAGAGPASAQGSQDWAAVKGMDERFRLDLGGFFQKFETTVRVDSEKFGQGTEVNLEDDLGRFFCAVPLFCIFQSASFFFLISWSA